MKLYKFKSLDSYQHLLDLLLNERLYCALYKDLNDPFEGLFAMQMIVSPRILGGSSIWTSIAGVYEKEWSIEDLKLPSGAPSRICSLSSDPSDVRLWAYYADSQRGVAVELDFSGHASEAVKVEYEETLRTYDGTAAAPPDVREILRWKTKHWAFEAEYRIITDQNYYDIAGRISRILCGPRMTDESVRLIERATGGRFPVVRMELNRQSVKVVEKSGTGDVDPGCVVHGLMSLSRERREEANGPGGHVIA